MGDAETAWLFAAAVVMTLANLPLLWIAPIRGEQQFWRRLGVARLRRRLTRRRPASFPHSVEHTIRASRANIIWHLVLGAVFAMLIVNPWFVSGPLRPVRYLLLAPSVAYFFGSLVQRQKIVVSINARARRSRKD